MHPTEKAKLISFYEAELARYGPHDPRSLHWVSQRTQRARFQALYELGPWEGASVADIGCGLGDFYGYLQQQGHRLLPLTSSAAQSPPSATEPEVGVVYYAGYDISPKMVSAARLKYPEAYFQMRDILEEGFEQPCDFVIASGTFNIRIADHERFFRDMVAVMYQNCLRAIAFNFLGPSGYSPWSDGRYYGVDPEVVVAYCRTLCACVSLKIGYLPSDYTVYMYKA